MKRFVVGCLLACATLPLWATERLPDEGKIQFQVIHGGTSLEVGEAEHRWRYNGQRYQMSNAVKTTGVAAMLADFHYVQRSEGDVLQKVLRPQRFSVDQRGRERESAEFDWDGQTVLVTRRKNRQTSYPLAEGDIDVLSVWHLAAVSGMENLPKTLSAVNNRNSSPATLTRLGIKTVQLPLGAFEAQHVRLKAASEKLTIDLWLSSEHASLPVRVLLTDDEGKTLDLRATAVQMGAQD